MNSLGYFHPDRIIFLPPLYRPMINQPSSEHFNNISFSSSTEECFGGVVGGFLTVHCSNCFSRASESPSAGHSSFRKTSTSDIHFFKVLTSFWEERRTGPRINSEPLFWLGSQAACSNPSNPSHLKLHQFGHELLDFLGIVRESHTEASPARHDGVHLSTIPGKNTGESFPYCLPSVWVVCCFSKMWEKV